MADAISVTPQALQQKLYFMLEQLQSMAKELSPRFQQRLPCELLSSLANCLLNDTVFEIVKGLMDIQHVTEKHLFQQRQQVVDRHKLEMQKCIQSNINEDTKEKQLTQLQMRHKEELKQIDMKVILQLDQKVSEQQVVLERAGVPGFYVTNNTLEIQVQMHLLDFIIRLSRKRTPA